MTPQTFVAKEFPQPFKTNIWILFYRQGSNMEQKIFQLTDATIIQAAERGKEHCRLMSYSYQYVKPLISDLEFDESKKLRNFGEQSARESGHPAA